MSDLTLAEELNLIRAQLRRTQLDLVDARARIDVITESNAYLAKVVARLQGVSR